MSPYPGETTAAKHLALPCSLITTGETLLAKTSLSLATVKLRPQRLSVPLGRLLTSEIKLKCTSVDPPLLPPPCRSSNQAWQKNGTQGRNLHLEASLSIPALLSIPYN